MNWSCRHKIIIIIIFTFSLCVPHASKGPASKGQGKKILYQSCMVLADTNDIHAWPTQTYVSCSELIINLNFFKKCVLCTCNNDLIVLSIKSSVENPMWCIMHYSCNSIHHDTTLTFLQHHRAPPMHFNEQ